VHTSLQSSGVSSNEILAGTWVVVPVFNECAAVGSVLQVLRATFPNVVAVDDGSSDGSWDHVRTYATHPLRHAVNRGQGAALQTGTDFALSRGAPRIAHFDSDGQHRVDDLVRMADAVANGECDIALGDRFRGGSKIPLLRAALIRIAAVMHLFTSGIALSDVHNGLRVLSAEAARRCELRSDRMAHASELIDLIAQSGLRVKQFPTTIDYNSYSLAKGQRSSASARILVHYGVGKVFR
jgi:glycosyltransferase involved in cell wall biosynthesis